MKKKLIILSFLFAFALLVGCGGTSGSSDSPPDYNATIDAIQADLEEIIATAIPDPGCMSVDPNGCGGVDPEGLAQDLGVQKDPAEIVTGRVMLIQRDELNQPVDHQLVDLLLQAISAINSAENWTSGPIQPDEDSSFSVHAYGEGQVYVPFLSYDRYDYSQGSARSIDTLSIQIESDLTRSVINLENNAGFESEIRNLFITYTSSADAAGYDPPTNELLRVLYETTHATMIDQMVQEQIIAGRNPQIPVFIEIHGPISGNVTIHRDMVSDLEDILGIEFSYSPSSVEYQKETYSAIFYIEE